MARTRKRWSVALGLALGALLALGGCTAPASPKPAAGPAGGAPAGGGAAPAAGAPAPAAAPAAGRAPERIVFGTAGRTLDNLPIMVAQEWGLFAAEGLEVEVALARSDVAVAALVAREMDYSNNVLASLAAAIGGAPLVTVHSVKENLLLYLVSQPQVTTVDGLRGGTIGHGGTRGADWAATVDMLHYFGLEPGQDVQLISTTDSGGGLAALLSGAVVASALRLPHDGMAVKEGYRRLISAPDVLEPVPDIAVTTHRLKLQENPAQVRRVVRAVLRGVYAAVDRPDDAIALIQREFELDPVVARLSYESLKAAFNLRGEASDEAMQAAIRRAQSAGDVRQTTFAPRDFVDWTIVREVKQELGR
jgi:ABC-type nitrate/sulfonate/bicarbonate transport system substrate-binding protein